MDALSDIIIVIPIVLFSLSVHEYFHAWTALKLGDPTAKRMGRLTINPIAHIDFMGLIFAIIFRFGWAKPVPVNPFNFRKPLQHNAIVAAAGPLSNLILSAISIYTLKGLSIFFQLPTAVIDLLYISAFINAALFFFNLIPVPPLDGSRILFALLPGMTLWKTQKYEIYGSMGLFLIMMLSWAGGINIFKYFVSLPAQAFIKFLL